MRYFVIAILLTLPLVVGCVPAVGDAPYIDFNDVDPTVIERVEMDDLPLRVAVAAVISPEGTAESYRLLLGYLGERLGRPVELVQRRTYMEINNLLEAGQVDLAFVCTSGYVYGHDAFGMRLLVAPEVNGETVYRSLLIVPSDSDARSIEDLQGATFVFTDPISTTGRAYPIYLLTQLGYDPQSFFGHVFYTYSHDNAIRAVADRIADGAAVDSLVYRFALERDPELGDRVRVIHESPPFGIPPVVVGPNATESWIEELRRIFLTMHETPEGQEALAAIGVDRFVMVDDSAYDGVRLIHREALVSP